MNFYPNLALQWIAYLTLYGLLVWAFAGLWKPQWQQSKIWRWGIYIGGGVLYLAVVFHLGWLSDDAFILFRPLEQVLHGRGPVWNPNERVQAFTSPLWFILLLLMRAFSVDVFLNAIWAHFVMAVGLLWLYARRFSPWRYLMVVLLAVVSRGFVDFATSGLENSLGYLLITWWIFEVVDVLWEKETLPSERKLLELGLLSAAILLTRLDWLLLVIPGLIGVSLSFFRRSVAAIRKIAAFGIGLVVPLLLWHTYALIFFGSPLPNTFYAKLTSEVPHSYLAVQGFRYYYGMSLLLDPSILVVPAIVLLLAWWQGRRVRWVSLGLLLYGAYVGWIGGDFMLNRFFTVPYAMALALLGIQIWPWRSLFRKHRAVLAGLQSIVFLGIAFFALFFVDTPLNIPIVRAGGHGCGIADERSFYRDTNTFADYLKHLLKTRQFLCNPSPRQNHFSPPAIGGAIGVWGYCAGTEKNIIDYFALSDAFLSHLPANSTTVRIGHFRRDIPSFYPESATLGLPLLPDPQLNQLLVHTFRATRAPFWIPARWRSITFLLSGQYLHLTAHLGSPHQDGPPAWPKNISVSECAENLRFTPTAGWLPKKLPWGEQ